MKIMSVWNTMKVFRGQEANLEPSKGFYRGNSLPLEAGARLCQVFKNQCPKPRKWKIIIKIHGSRKIDAKQWKSMNIYESHQRTRSRFLWGHEVVTEGRSETMKCNKTMHIYEIYEHPWNLWKSTKIHENLWKSMTSMKIYEIQRKFSEGKKPAWNRAKVFIRLSGRNWRPQPGFQRSMLRNLWKTM